MELSVPILIGCCSLLICVVAAIVVIAVILWNKGDDVANFDIIGVGTPVDGQTETVVKLAAEGNTAKVVDKIASLKIKAIDQKEYDKAMKALSTSKKVAAAHQLLNLPNPDRVFAHSLFLVATIQHVQSTNAVPEVRVKKIAKCPPGYDLCSSKKFNPTATTGATAAFSKRKIASNQLCCKYTNAIGDPRPSCKKSVKKAQKTYSILFIVGTIVVSLIPIPGLTLEAMIGLMGATMALAPLSGIYMESMIMEEIGGNPMRDCCKDSFFDGDPPDAHVLKDFTDENGKKATGMWTTGDGCPVLFNTPNAIEYAQALNKALKRLVNDVGGEINFPEKDPSNCSNGGCKKIVTYEQWAVAGKKPIGCYFTCPNSQTANKDLSRGRCNLACDTSGQTHNFAPWRNI